MAVTPPSVMRDMIGALRAVGDLDALHFLLSNDGTDLFDSPRFSAWLLELVNTERSRRRDDGATTANYRLCEFAELPARELIRATWAAVAINDAAAVSDDASIRTFCRELLKLFVASMSAVLIYGAGNCDRNPTK